MLLCPRSFLRSKSGGYEARVAARSFFMSEEIIGIIGGTGLGDTLANRIKNVRIKKAATIMDFAPSSKRVRMEHPDVMCPGSSPSKAILC
jgi:hypothetical protein